MQKLIVHISETAITTTTGMGRVEYHWQQAFERAGYQFIHIGPAEVGPLLHRALFPYKVLQHLRKLNLDPSALIVHEPASGWFVNKGIPCFLESHGIERRGWEWQLAHDRTLDPASRLSRRTRWLYPVWRLAACDRGIKRADRLLLINSDDRDFVTTRYRRSEKDIFLFRNGVQPGTETKRQKQAPFTILFNGTWIERKGIRTLVRAAEWLYERNVDIRYVLIGTGKNESTVLNDWPAYLRDKVRVVPQFSSADEGLFLSSADLFVLPSYMEGQPLSLLQAMAAGTCCITTACCGQKDIIEHGKTGLLFEPGDYMALAGLIKSCMENVPFRQEIGSNARTYCRQIDWNTVSDELAHYVISTLSRTQMLKRKYSTSEPCE